MSQLNFADYTERAIGQGHPTQPAVIDRALKQMLTESGYDPDATTFPGLAGPVFNVKANGLLGNGTTNDATALQALATTVSSLPNGGTLFFPRGRYLMGAGITNIGNNIQFRGEHATLVKGFNGDILTIGTGSENVWFYDLDIAGEGATFTGRGLVVPGGFDKDVRWVGGNILDMDGPCIEFGANGGNRSLVAFCRLGINGATGSGAEEPAIKHNATDTGAVQRHFISVQCEPFTRLFHDTPPGSQTGGGGIIADCYTGGITLHANSLGIQIKNSRFAFDSTIDGAAVNIQGCNFGSACTINSGFSQSRFQGCLVAGTFTDNSFVGNNMIDPPATNIRERNFAAVVDRKVVLTDAANIDTPAVQGNYFTVTLGASRNMNAPTGTNDGHRITYEITQDGTGGRNLTWNAIFHHAWSDTGNTAGKFSTITFRFNATAGVWRQEGAQSPYIT